MNPNNKPRQFIHVYSEYVRAGVHFMVLSIILIAALSASYVALRGIWVGIKMVLQAIGTSGG